METRTTYQWVGRDVWCRMCSWEVRESCTTASIQAIHQPIRVYRRQVKDHSVPHCQSRWGRAGSLEGRSEHRLQRPKTLCSVSSFQLKQIKRPSRSSVSSPSRNHITSLRWGNLACENRQRWPWASREVSGQNPSHHHGNPELQPTNPSQLQLTIRVPWKKNAAKITSNPRDPHGVRRGQRQGDLFRSIANHRLHHARIRGQQIGAPSPQRRIKRHRPGRKRTVKRRRNGLLRCHQHQP